MKNNADELDHGHAPETSLEKMWLYIGTNIDVHVQHVKNFILKYLYMNQKTSLKKKKTQKTTLFATTNTINRHHTSYLLFHAYIIFFLSFLRLNYVQKFLD